MPVLAELDALAAALSTVAADVNSDATVHVFDLDGPWEGSWPLIIVKPAGFDQVRTSGGGLGTKGQDSNHMNLYSVEIQDVDDPPDTSTDRTAAGQRRSWALVDAITDYFNSRTHAQLGGAAYLAGERIRFVPGPPFKATTSGNVLSLTGHIWVLGNEQEQVP